MPLNIAKFPDFTIASNAIEAFCKNETNRQRDYLYNYLDEKLNITIDRSAYNYEDKRSENARFECTNVDEVKTVRDRIIRELKKK